MKKVYVCERWPRYRIGDAEFQDGKLTTSDEDVQEMIEHNESYGVHIHLADQGEVQVALPTEPEPEEEPTPRRGPGRPPSSSGARQGTTGTKDLRGE